MDWKQLRRWEKVAYIVILLLALFTRFYILGDRVMSHDESLHTKFSWYLYAGQGYSHNPMMHGPLLFHMTALNYFLFGSNDFVARIFPALVGVALVMTPLLFRRWLGQWGSLAAAIMLLISPSISYYSRYIRHDAGLLLTTTLLLWAIFRYIEKREDRWLYVLAAAFSFMYTTKEASYLHTAIFGGLLALPFFYNILFADWLRPQFYPYFLILLALILIMGGLFVYDYIGADVSESALDPAGNTRVADVAHAWWGRAAAVIAILGVIGAIVIAFFGMGEERTRNMHIFDVLMTIGTLTLPLGAAFLVQMAGVDMLSLYNVLLSNDIQSLFGPTLIVTVIVLFVTLAASALLGMWWDPRRWPIIAGIHYTIFIVFYTTVFTNPIGLFSGMLGGLAYWMAQHGVVRGGQPWYYYFLVTPLYDYLPVFLSLGSAIGALVLTVRQGLTASQHNADTETRLPHDPHLPTFWPLFLLGWTLLAWAIYSWAGEKMPWLAVHITLPSIFLAAWGAEQILKGLDLRRFITHYGWLALLALPFTVTGIIILSQSFGNLSGIETTPAGSTLDQLQLMGNFFGGLLGLLIFGGALIWAGMRVGPGQLLRLALGALLGFASLLTVRTMVMFNYVNHDMATEFLVYAHAAPHVKIALQQIEEVSWRTTGSANDIAVAYSEDGSWPFSWYMTDYPNAYFYGTTPDPSRLLESPAIIAGAAQYQAVDAIIGDNYIYYDYIYLWWPIQDYFGLTNERVGFALTDPVMRAALWDIIWDRDYRAYAAATGQTLTTNRWPLRKDFRLYVRRNIAYEIWGQHSGSAGTPAGEWIEPTPAFDPYTIGAQTLPLISSITLPTGATPRGLALAPDGTLYATDTTNHQVWHLSTQGVLGSWGGPGTGPGQFNEPWGIAVDAAGQVYVADTWNHRVQVFDAQGRYITDWHGPQNDPTTIFFGPRGIAVGDDGNIYITDTGNKRVQVYTPQGTLVRTIGGVGWEIGQLNEPVGIAVTGAEIYLADSWNRRVQVLDLEGNPLRAWNVSMWDLSDPEDKPYLAVGFDNNVYVSNPQDGRIVVFDAYGTYLWSAGQHSDTGQGLTFPVGLIVSPTGALYVADAHTGRVLGYSLP